MVIRRLRRLSSEHFDVALPSIRSSLHFSSTSLAWVVNGYMLTFGGFLLLGGRLGDLHGHRRLFIGGIALFTLLLGCGGGMAFNPMLLAAMSDVEPERSGLASGVVNTSFMMGGALGLAILASLAASRTSSLAGAGTGHLAALDGGYHLAFLAGAIFAALAALVGGSLLRGGAMPAPASPELHGAHEQAGMPAVEEVGSPV